MHEGAQLDRYEFYADVDNALEVLAQVRRDQPVFWYEPGKFWALLKYEDIKYVSSHPELFSNRYGFQVYDNYEPGSVPESVMEQLPGWAKDKINSGRLSRAEVRGVIAQGKLATEEREDGIENLVTSDPPRHGQLRKLLTKGLTPRAVARLEPRVAGIVEEALDAVAPGGVVDLVQTVASTIPAYVVADLVGAPRADKDKFIRWTDAFILNGRLSELEPSKQTEVVAELEEFRDYVLALMDSKRANPGNDLISGLILGEVDGERLSVANVEMLTLLLISGGSETTRHLISATAWLLAEHPEQRALLLEKPQLIGNALEEVLRFFPIVWSECRTALEQTEIRGHTIEKDDYIAMLYPSANRDEDVWEHPTEFDITRSFDPTHFAFGWGEHLCPGMSLARLEGRLALEKLLARFPDWELAGEPVRMTSMFFNGFLSMPIRLG